MTKLLELKKITKKFEVSSEEKDMTVLEDISFQMDQGESVAVVGPSGSGKSTLLNIIGALDRPTSGDVFFFGKNLSHLHDSELSAMRNREIGFIFQLHHLLPQCTVLENVLIPTIPLGIKKNKNEMMRRAKALLEKVHLKERMDFFPAVLSGGELQRVAVVRALINSPKLILADEPTGSLDKKSSENLGRLLVDLNREEGVALITVTHSMDLARLMNKIYSLQNGKLEPVC
ncbi:MAG: ABC transporter ATP-binding protein [Candidatus Aminicenantes bacterium]|nr:ABC transporter ATP-binding protein [Candidatus Aminicenantes bacterium]